MSEKKEVKNEVVKRVVQQRQYKRRPKQKRTPKMAAQNKKPYVMKVPRTIASTNSYTTAIQTSMCQDALRLVACSIASYVLEKENSSFSNKNSDLQFADLWNAMNWMINGMWSEIIGAELVLTSRPKVVHDLINALINKSANARGGKIAYSWEADAPPHLLESFSTSSITYWARTSIGTTIPAYNNSYFTGDVTGDKEAYSRICKILDNQKNHLLKSVKADSKSQLALDVSTRSRAYRYCGLAPCTSSGWALSVENELPIWCPNLAKFVDYDSGSEDSRIPTQLTIGSGDACSMMGLKLSGFFGSYYNRCCPKFVFIDFEEIYTVLCLWMVKLKNAAVTTGGFNSNNGDIATSSLPFSQQDFRIALIQALKGALGTSYITQFIGPLLYNQAGNMFIPTTDSGANYANRTFAQKLMVPLLIQENINSLKMRAVEIPKSKHKALYVPVLGRYFADTPGSFQFGVGETSQNLFSTPAQEIINILDGTMGNVPVDLNDPYYAGVISDWNSHVAALLTWSATTGPLVSDNGPVGLPLVLTSMSVTNYEGNDVKKKMMEKIDYAVKKGHLVRRDSAGVKIKPLLADKYLTNFEPVKKTDGKNVTYLPAASVSELNLIDMYTLIPEIDSELAALMGSLILPSIRLTFNSDSGDVITSQMFQVHTRFLNVVPYAQWGGRNSQSLYTKLDQLASYCITGIGHDSAGQYDRLVKLLQDESKGAGILSTLAGIVGSIFPGVAPIANAIAGALDS